MEKKDWKALRRPNGEPVRDTKGLVRVRDHGEPGPMGQRGTPVQTSRYERAIDRFMGGFDASELTPEEMAGVVAAFDETLTAAAARLADALAALGEALRTTWPGRMLERAVNRLAGWLSK